MHGPWPVWCVVRGAGTVWLIARGAHLYIWGNMGCATTLPVLGGAVVHA